MNINIVDLVSSYGISLRKVGNVYQGLCPFHEEKTPSFTVYPETNSFYCFGCQKSGNWKTFLKYMDPSLLDTFKLNILSLEMEASKITTKKNYKSYLMLAGGRLFYKLFGLLDKSVVYYMMSIFDKYLQTHDYVPLSHATKILNLLKKQGEKK